MRWSGSTGVGKSTVATQLATRLDRTNRKLGDLAFVDVTGRVAHAIMDLCREPDAMTHPDGMQITLFQSSTTGE